MALRKAAFAWAGAMVLAQGSWGPLLAQGDLEPTLARARAAAARRDYPAAIDALQMALEQVRRAAPLTIEKFMAVQEPAKIYGGYVARRNAEFRRGEKLHFYLEPKNLVYPKSADGTYRPAFDVGFEILDKEGDSVAKQDRFGSFEFSSKSALQDIYVNLDLTVEGAPPGAYEVRFTVKDANSAKTATVTHAFTIL